jgi:hypothetical protein
MKFFTPQLFLKIQDGCDHDEQWERNVLLYKEQFDKLPEDVEPLKAVTSLHDATLLACHELKNKDVVLLVCPYPVEFQSRNRLLTITYKDARLTRVAAPQDFGQGDWLPEWMYDEIEHDPEKILDVFTHRILISTGEELVIEFDQVQVKLQDF